MNKKLFGALCLAIACTGAALFSNGYLVSSPSNDSLFLENVEALSSSESGGSGRTCYSTITSKAGCQVRYCPTCSFVSGTDTWYAPSHTC